MNAPRDHLPVWPGNEFDILASSGRTHIVCANFPECGCGDDCPHATASHPAADRVALAFILATVLIAGGLLVWSFLP